MKKRPTMNGDYSDTAIAILQITLGISWTGLLGIEIFPPTVIFVNIVVSVAMWYYIFTRRELP